MEAKQQYYYSPEEYLELETAAEYKSEYYDGQIYPMAGGTPNHNQIAGNFYAALNFAFKGQPYQVFMSDMRLWIPQKRLYTYPDVMVVSGQLEFAEGRRDTITNPLMIAEVLSESTANYDRGEKFKLYRTISSLKEYIIISQSDKQVEQFSKTIDNKWILSEYDEENALLALTSVQFQISLLDIYDKVDFESEA
jgi:Uma2 family endonuclease